MHFSDLTHWLKGYVSIEATGPFPERFLTVCSRRTLCIRNVKHRGESRLTADVEPESFRRLRPVCRRTETRVKILARHGLPFLLFRYRKRKWSLIGVVLLIVLLWYTSGHIMGITVIGNQRIDTQTITAHLKNCGITLGSPSGDIQPDEIRNQMMRELDDLAWIGINSNGSRLYIEVVERTVEEPRLPVDTPCHLTAAKDGEVLQVLARNGQTMVKPGSGVRKGDVLVSGLMDAGADLRTVHAYGEVYAKVLYRADGDYSFSYDATEKTGKQTVRRTLRILNGSLPLFFGNANPYEESECHAEEVELRPPFDLLPSVYLVREVYDEQITVHKKRSPAEALENAKAELHEKLAEEIPDNAEVLEEQIQESLTEHNSLRVTLTVVCKENIAKETQIHTEVE